MKNQFLIIYTYFLNNLAYIINMDIIADADEGSGDGVGFGSSALQDNTMENTSHGTGNSWNSSDEYSVDGLGNRVQRVYENEEQKNIYKQRKTIQKIKSNIGQFFKENTIGDLLPNN